ncbi:hypothetical protein ACLOJK_016001 [Asimina triloba]
MAYQDQEKGGEGEGEGEVNDSPIEQVRLTVPIEDDNTMPVLTFRVWVLGLICCVLLAGTDQFFDYRQNLLSLPPSCLLIVAFPIGKLMAATLPSTMWKVPGMKWTFTLNPGPFNIKEHVMIAILAYAGSSDPYALVIVQQMKAFFHRRINPLAALLVTQTSQLLGYGFAGFFVKFLVESPYMWWPPILADVTFYRTLHEKAAREKGKLTRLQFFIIATVSSFAYYIFPGYFFQSLTALSFVCWIRKDSVRAQQLGSGLHGLGFGSFTLDWSTVTSFLGNPLFYPISTVVNMMIGFVLLLYIITPLAYWTNAYDAKRFPIFSANLFDSEGNQYNISRALNEKSFVFDEAGYKSYSNVHLSALYVFAWGFMFASITASLSHFAFFHGRSVWKQLRQANSDESQVDDIHIRTMRKNYDPIPQWWFLVLLITTTGLSIFTLEGFGRQLQLRFWGVFLAIGLTLIFIIPVGVIQATTGQARYLYPGRPLAYLSFKVYGILIMGQALTFLSDLKFAYYMKIPPKSLFIVEVVGMLVSSSVNFGVTWVMLTSIKNICDVSKLPQGSPWTCPGGHLGNSILSIWGIVGPSNIFAPHGDYSMMYLFFGVGVLVPFLIWITSLAFPSKKWIREINFPIILLAASYLPLSGAVHYLSWFPVAFFFNYVVYRRYKGWWAKYNYVLALGLDAGVAFMSLLISFVLQSQGVYGIRWWGLPLDDHCPLAQCPTAPDVHVQGCPVFH